MNPHLVTVFVTLFTIANPIGNIPLFLTLTAEQSLTAQRRTALITAVAVAITFVVCLFFGQAILKLLGINLYAFKIAGMFVISSLAWSMIRAEPSSHRHTKAEHEEAMQKDSVAVVPLAIPITAGGGAMAAVISYAGNVQNQAAMLEGILAIMAVALSIWAIYASAPLISRLLGVSGMTILTRVFGLLLLAIAITTIADALTKLFPVLVAA
jgi:multiple antibiotic resistance protein